MIGAGVRTRASAAGLERSIIRARRPGSRSVVDAVVGRADGALGDDHELREPADCDEHQQDDAQVGGDPRADDLVLDRFGGAVGVPSVVVLRHYVLDGG